MSSLVVRGGSVIDGSGSPARRADVLVVDGRIVEVGTIGAVSEARELDALGALVAPGFIDGHTHLDPTLFWDRSADPMPQHGVTTVLVGNCSLGLAPMRPDMVDEVSRIFCYIEDLPRESFDAGIEADHSLGRGIDRRALLADLTRRSQPVRSGLVRACPVGR